MKSTVQTLPRASSPDTRGNPQPITPHLANRSEFEHALTNYAPSKGALKTLAQTPFVMLTAPTSTGRNTLIDELVKTGHYHFVVSDTTRPPRYNDGVLEQDGIRYHFKTEAEVLAGIKQGAYIEAEVIHDQQVSGQSIREVELAHREGKVAINEVDIGGALNMKHLKPDVTAILVLPPSFDEWLRRIQKRTHVSPVELKRRLKRAVELLDTALGQDFFIFVVNDDFHKAVYAIDQIATLSKHDKSAELAARELARKLSGQTKTFLQADAN